MISYSKRIRLRKEKKKKRVTYHKSQTEPYRKEKLKQFIEYRPNDLLILHYDNNQKYQQNNNNRNQNHEFGILPPHPASQRPTPHPELARILL
jgi:hypothetical protein